MNRALLVLSTVPVIISVLLIGSLADFHDVTSHTAFALGVCAAIPGFTIGGWIEDRSRRTR